MREFPSILNTLGLLLQVNGVAFFLSIASAFYFGEVEGIAAFSFMALLSISLGFILVTLFKSEEHSYPSLCVVILLAFLTLGSLGSIPYVMMGEMIFKGSMRDEVLINSLFESFSGYTTTGLTTITDYSSLPRSLIYYRSITQWLGGLNILFLTLLFFASPGAPSRLLPELLGIERIRPTYKQNFVQLLKVYVLLTAAFIALLVSIGVEPFYAINIVLAGVSTGGFVPVDDMGSVIDGAALVIVACLMIVGAVNFSIHEWAFGRRGRSVYVMELIFWIGITVPILLLFVASRGMGEVVLDVFHVLSAATTTGFQLSDISLLADPHKVLLLILFFIGGNSFSTAGGLKIIRVILIVKSLLWLIRRLGLPARAVIPLTLAKRDIRREDLLLSVAILVLGGVIIIISSIILSLNGVTFTDALFEATSAWATTGLTSGVTASLDGLPKLVLIIDMVLGRIEVIPFMVVISYLTRRLLRI